MQIKVLSPSSCLAPAFWQ